MLHSLFRVALFVTFGTALASILYVAFATYAVARSRNRCQRASPYLPPGTVLKPVCGLDPNLYENLRSFCEQTYPRYQVVFGVRNARDPAIQIIERVIADFPDRDLALVVDDLVSGTNFKVSLLANMLGAAKYDILVIADSDMRVNGDYLATVLGPFRDAGVGAVTCLYKGIPVGGLPSILGTMFINEWFLPSVLVALNLKPLRYCFGATMAVRVEALRAIGGFQALASHLADDYMLGKLISEQGYKIHLAPYLVENVVLEPDLKSLFLHELRWARTVRTVQPLGYALSFVTYSLPMSALFVLVSQCDLVGMVVLALAIGGRTLLHYTVRATFRLPGPAKPWLVPIRDLLSFTVWCASFLGRSVHWREKQFSVYPDGQLAMSKGHFN